MVDLMSLNLPAHSPWSACAVSCIKIRCLRLPIGQLLGPLLMLSQFRQHPGCKRLELRILPLLGCFGELCNGLLVLLEDVLQIPRLMTHRRVAKHAKLCHARRTG
jgi:hypothetical protein